MPVYQCFTRLRIIDRPNVKPNVRPNVEPNVAREKNVN